MTLDLLVCPGCRTLSGDRLDVRTLEARGHVLACDCGRRYPIVDGVPIVMADPAGYLRAEMSTVVERDLPAEVAALLVEDGPDEASYPRLLEHLSIYLDAHWADNALAPLLARMELSKVATAVELGCSVGRVLAHLADTAEHVVGIDMHFGAIRRARKLLAGERVEYPRRMIGRHYERAETQGIVVAADRRTLLCSDVLDPPLLPEAFERVVALNMLDSVAHPRQLISVIDGLCAPGGEIILACPYQWQSATMAEHERFGGADPAATLTAILREGAGLRRTYTIEDEAEIPWTLRRDARSSVTYRTHYVRARKGT